ncbi:hypothetical protein [Silvanigrella sp.]|jgi:hypothetical protein|uniref:hypothetical protein n=1 Tax=Silvanigrella sp. TaxID=2024976 RepID=UPI0037CAEE2F|nr:hypothetical protein [Silvanigrellaceae bacterium]
MNHKKFFLGCDDLIRIMSKYYSFINTDPIDNYVLPPSNNIPENCGQTLFEENSENNEFFIGIQFGKKIVFDFENNEIVSLNSLAVVSEEISHFKLITDIVTLNSNVSTLEIETLGEIDRFLCLMHWNSESSLQKINKNWKNLHQICDEVFQGNRFLPDQHSLYREAECLAFRHLKEAFSYDWDSSNYDFSKINNRAKNYLSNLRKNILRA